MRQIIYTSVCAEDSAIRIAPAILRSARLHNGMDGVTGLLCATDERFLQVLEGPKESVALTFARILADPRHRDIETLADRPIADRDFWDWTMAFRDQGQPPEMLGDRLAVLLAGVSEDLTTRFRRFVGH